MPTTESKTTSEPADGRVIKATRTGHQVFHTDPNCDNLNGANTVRRSRISMERAGYTECKHCARGTDQ